MDSTLKGWLIVGGSALLGVAVGMSLGKPFSAERMASHWTGLSRGKTARDFETRALEKGTRVELEHTNQRVLAERIAMDHLMEDPDYYEKLKS